VVGPQSYHRLPELIARTRAENRALVETEFPEDDKFAQLPPRAPPRGVTAFLTVQEGCDKFCTFCVVPYTRGMEYSRAVADVEREALALVASGVRELTLLGQNVNGYHGLGPDGRTYSLADLIRHLAQIDGLERLRYTTSHPRDMSDDLIAARCVGRTLPVLFEKVGRRPGQLIGRSPYLQSVHAEAPANMLGRLVPVEISSFGPNSLAGVIRPE
jgi:tRNA-2-methylthio-N6-dimethylallyladenosine synthase